MKKQMLIFVLPLLMLACRAPEGKEKLFTLKGEATGYETGWVHLLKREKGQFITLDSTMVEAGAFTMTGKLDYPLYSYLKLEGHHPFIAFFLEPGDITLSVNVDDLANPLVSGSKNHEVYQTFQDDIEIFERQQKDIYTEILGSQAEGNHALVNGLEQQFDSIEQEKKEYIARYIKDNASTVASAFLALRNLYILDLNDLEGILTAFDPSVQGSHYVVSLTERVARLRNVQIGKKAPDFTMNDSIGNPVTLSSLFGNYLFVDFWASWCGPCRHEKPNLVAAFQKYHPYGFDILGVSLDRNRENWLKAIHDDKQTWHHVSDLAGWGNEAAELYAVNSIPSSVLLDPNGVIIARNLKGEALHEKLEEIFGSK